MQTREQQFASDAYQKVKAIADDEKKSESYRREYGSMAHKLPILIHVSGLAQALSFVESRGKEKGSGQLLADLGQTVLGQSTPVDDFLARSRGDTQESSLREYLYLTEQTLAALLWYKRYAQSILNIELGEDEHEDAEEKEVVL